MTAARAGGELLAELVGPLAHGLGHRPAVGPQEIVGQHLVEDDGPEMEPPGAELLGEELCLSQGHGLEGRDDHERRAAIGQQSLDGLGALHEPGVHGLEEDEELGDVREELRAQDAVGNLVEGPGGGVHESRPIRDDEPAQEARGEELGHPFRGVEEVERIAGGRRVDDDEVVVALGVDLVEALHGDVVMALDEPTRDVAVQGVGQDLVAGARVGGMAPNEGVPRLLHVEHGRPQLAPGTQSCRPEGVVGHAVLVIADSAQAQSVGQPAGGVHGEDEHLAAVALRSE